MGTILINPQQIESCWESKDVCFVKTKTGRVWLCSLIYPFPDKYGIIITTKEFLLKSKDTLVELVLAQKGKSE